MAKESRHVNGTVPRAPSSTVGFTSATTPKPEKCHPSTVFHARILIQSLVIGRTGYRSTTQRQMIGGILRHGDERFHSLTERTNWSVPRSTATQSKEPNMFSSDTEPMSWTFRERRTVFGSSSNRTELRASCSLIPMVECAKFDEPISASVGHDRFGPPATLRAWPLSLTSRSIHANSTFRGAAFGLRAFDSPTRTVQQKAIVSR